MNLNEYFNRIGFHGSYEKPDLETLVQIHKHHVMSIPFENLSIHCGEQITMDLQVIFHKIVRCGRGGWCMENNLLFWWVLREMGYDTTMLGCRVYDGHLGDFGKLDTHLINKVVISGETFVTDVSFGVSYQLREPLELVSNKDQPQAAGVFRLMDKGDVWVLEKTGRKPQVLDPEFAKSGLVSTELTKPIYCFTMQPRNADHFSDVCHFLQTDPSSLFTNKSICSLQTSTGFRALIGWTYSDVTFKPEDGVDVMDIRCIADDAIEEILRENFNMKLETRLKPVNNKVTYKL
uniref:arylamine N-acetyltransferase n=2 Tax=Sphaeramia orbicularis TaxID=375764 RepID=A0A672Y9K8_9TELE